MKITFKKIQGTAALVKWNYSLKWNVFPFNSKVKDWFSSKEWLERYIVPIVCSKKYIEIMKWLKINFRILPYFIQSSFSFKSLYVLGNGMLSVLS